MAKLCKSSDSASSHLPLTLLYDNLLSFVVFLYSHPLHLAYLLYFSPYIIRLLSFLFPLLLSTSILLTLFSLHSLLQGEHAAASLLEQLESMLAATIGNVFEREFESMGSELCDIVCPISEVEDASPVEVMGDVGEDQIVSIESSESVDAEAEDQDNRKGCSFVPQTPDRTSEILTNSRLARRAKQRSGSFESLSRSRSTRSESIGGGPGEMSWECSEKSELSRSWSWKGRSFSSTSSMLEEGLQRDGSMRKEREWKRTLACKLYEERMSFKLREETATAAEEAEDMDLLWEAYEAGAEKANKFKNKKKEACIEEEDEEEDDDESVGRFCCLQALRFPRVGMAKPNLAKASKVFKGTAFFQRSRSSRSRKG